jgi:hypothetical protein
MFTPPQPSGRPDGGRPAREDSGQGRGQPLAPGVHAAGAIGRAAMNNPSRTEVPAPDEWGPRQRILIASPGVEPDVILKGWVSWLVKPLL